MDQARQSLMINLARHAAPARLRMALTLTSVEQLTGIPSATLAAIEAGCTDGNLTMDELTRLALFLGLTASGSPRSKPVGASWRGDGTPS